MNPECPKCRQEMTFQHTVSRRSLEVWPDGATLLRICRCLKCKGMAEERYGKNGQLLTIRNPVTVLAGIAP